MYKVESDFIHDGYRCVVVFTDMGHRCGYVGVPKENPLYGKSFTEYLDIPMSVIENEELGKRGVLPLFFTAFEDSSNVRMDMFFNVHGSLTYSNKGDYPVDGGDLWWLGFDCGHYDDGADLNLVEKYWGDNPRIQKRLEIEREFPTRDGYPVRTKEYVEDECKSLVAQIIKFVNESEKYKKVTLPA
jgi:hypothetical protein